MENTNYPSYQLSSYPIGSLKEIWAVSWPLILGFLSFGSMLFVDRLLLSYYSIQAFNAATNAGTAVFLILAIPTSIAGIAEVFVGKYHGEGLFHKVGMPVWQMIWFSILVTPFLWLIGWISLPFLFYKTGNEVLETDFFATSLSFASIYGIEMALGSFFVGIGRMKIVTIGTIAANLLNVVLDILLIFGWGIIPSMGAMGAAMATGFSQIFQVVFYAIIFLKLNNRKQYHTQYWHFDYQSFKEGLIVGAPMGFGRFMETLAHLVFFRLMILAGGHNLTIASIMQSLYILLSVSSLGISQAVTAIISNLIGGQQFHLIGKVLRSAFFLQFLFFIGILMLLLFQGREMMLFFFSSEEIHLLSDFNFLSSLYWSCLLMCLFYLFDGFCWVFIGHLTAAYDTKFIFYVGLITNLLAFIFPVFILVHFYAGEVIQAWIIIVLYSAINLFIYTWRYKGGYWKQKHVQPTHQTCKTLS